MFGAVKLTRHSVKSQFIYYDYEAAFDWIGKWGFLSYKFPRNIVIFGADNSSSRHSDNRKNFLVIGHGTTDVINNSVATVEKKLMVNFAKSNLLIET